MFDFHKLTVYQKSKILNKEFLLLVRDLKHLDRSLKDQLIRASTSILLNIAEGSGRSSSKDKAYFYTIAKGSAYECQSLLDILLDLDLIDNKKYKEFGFKLEEVVKMLFGLIKSLR